MLWICLLAVGVVLGPVIGCLLFVFLSANPSPLTAAAGAIVGMIVSLAAVFSLN